MTITILSSRELNQDVARAKKAAKSGRSERDTLIAATALVQGMTVVTRNVADFQSTGVTLLNPWASI